MSSAGVRTALVDGSGRFDAALDFVAARVRSGRLRRSVWLAFAAVLTLAAVVFGGAHRGEFLHVALILDLLATAPLLVVGQWPFASLAAVVAANSVFVAWGRPVWPPTAVVAWLVALAVSPLLLRRAQAVGLVVLAELAVLVGAVVPAAINPRPWDTPITEALAVLVVWGLGETFQSRRETQVQRRQVAAELRAAREREAVARGRADIARELHDVVAHHVSLIAVRAATTPYQLADVSPAAAAVFDEIAVRARTALDELRAVLGVLRDPDAVTPHAPQPGLADLPEFVDRMRADGMQVTLDIAGHPEASAAVQLCCYRVVQEALTNAARHAGGSPVDVVLRYDAADVAVTITNRLPGPKVASRPGFGLVGMRERVTALGGTLDVAAAGGTFRVSARIPTTARD